MTRIREILHCILVSVLFSGLSCITHEQKDKAKSSNVMEPWQSKGLIPVDLQPVPECKPLIISEKGMAKAVIVPAPDMPYYQEVAQFLSSYLKQATGAEFPIVASAPQGADAIYIGPAKAPGTKKILEKVRDLPPENFIVERFQGGVILAGNDTYRSIDLKKPLTIKKAPFAFGMQFCSKGTYLAAVDFLERFIGVRWYFISPLGTCVPNLKGKKIAMPSVKYQDGPFFPYRECSGTLLDLKAASECGFKIAPSMNKYYGRNEYEQWGNRNGNMSPGKLNHTDCYWGDLYGKLHPEYFALRKDGSRMIGKKGKEMFSCQRCYSNEGGFLQHLSNIEKYYTTGKGAKAFTDRPGECLPNDNYIYWAPNDGFCGCKCAKCQSKIDHNAPVNDQNSKLIWEYVVKLGEAIKARWPGKKLCVFAAYSGATEIPEGIKLPDNIVLTFCLMGGAPACYMKESKYKQRNQELLDAYYQITGKKVYLWLYPNLPYYSTHTLYPYPAPHAQAQFILKNKDKINGAFAQCGYTINAPSIYSRILWSPNFDVGSYLDEYSSKMYGKAAPHMKKFLDLRSRWENTNWSYLPSSVQLWKSIPDKAIWKETYPRYIRDKMEKCLEDARKAVPVGSIEYLRIKYVTEDSRPFFENGKFFDTMVKPAINCERTKNPPVIDGNLTDWPKESSVILKDWMGKPVEEKTEIMVSFDENAIYIAGKAHESGNLLLPPKGDKRINIFDYDSVEIYLCPEQIGMNEAGMAQTEQFFQIAINPMGQTLVNRKNLQSPSWKELKAFEFASAAKPSGNGFQFEIRIPYSSMAAPAPKAGQSEWFVNFYRNRPRGKNKGYQAWSPTLGKPFFETRHFGILRFQSKPVLKIDWEKVKTSIQNKEFIETSYKIKDRKYCASFKATKKLKEEGPPWIDLRLPSLPLDSPLVTEFAFRYKGKGLLEVNLCLKESREAKTGNRDKAVYRFIPSVLESKEWTDWIPGKLKASKETNKMKDISYWDVGLKLSSDADFEFEIGDFKVFKECIKPNP